MMKVIEPQFQRDFISLLPKELALQVLSYLEPKDLLRAAQTCRSWRFLADDNLLWKEKCKEANIVMDVTGGDRPKRGRAGNMPPISSPWKAAYMRQHIIEMNWRSRPIRTAKVLKGHDDHVITCLQFCGNRIVSGSDDNTLKVWSAITGKVSFVYPACDKLEFKPNFPFCTVPSNTGRSHGWRLVVANVREHNHLRKYRPHFESVERRNWSTVAHIVWTHFNGPLYAFAWK